MVENDCQQIYLICSNTLTFSSELWDEQCQCLVSRVEKSLLTQALPNYHFPFAVQSDVRESGQQVYTRPAVIDKDACFRN